MPLASCSSAKTYFTIMLYNNMLEIKKRDQNGDQNMAEALKVCWRSGLFHHKCFLVFTVMPIWQVVLLPKHASQWHYTTTFWRSKWRSKYAGFHRFCQWICHTWKVKQKSIQFYIVNEQQNVILTLSLFNSIWIKYWICFIVL